MLSCLRLSVEPIMQDFKSDELRGIISDFIKGAEARFNAPEADFGKVMLQFS